MRGDALSGRSGPDELDHGTHAFPLSILMLLIVFFLSLSQIFVKVNSFPVRIFYF